MGMSSTNMVMEEEESNIGDEMLTLLDNQADDNNEGSGDENGDGSVEDLGSDEEPADSDEVDELNQLDEQQCEELLRDTAVVQHTVTKVYFDQFLLLCCDSLLIDCRSSNYRSQSFTQQRLRSQPGVQSVYNMDSRRV
jgi:hypothetical protein